MRTAFFILIAIVLAGCARQQIATPQLSAQEARIVDIARRVVATNHWGKATFDRPQRRPEGGWSVLGWSVPAMPGGHWTFIIDDHEKLTEIIPGL